jgi:hypothetical protein
VIGMWSAGLYCGELLRMFGDCEADVPDPSYIVDRYR